MDRGGGNLNIPDLPDEKNNWSDSSQKAVIPVTASRWRKRRSNHYR